MTTVAITYVIQYATTVTLIKTSAVKAAFEQKSAHKPHHYIDRHGKCKLYPLRHVDKALYYRSMIRHKSAVRCIIHIVITGPLIFLHIKTPSTHHIYVQRAVIIHV